MGQTSGKPVDPSNPSYSFLKEKISNIMSVENRPVISLLPDDTVGKAVELFHSHNVLSAPIIDKDGKCFGFFAVDTMIVSLQYFCQLPVSLQGDSSVSYSVRKDAKEQLEHRAKLFFSHKVIEALEKQRSSSSFHGIRGEQSLEDALHIFAAGCQRIAVINNAKRVLAILSQSTILRYIAEDPRRLGALEAESAEHLGMPWHRIIKIPDTALVIDAADIMHDRGIYSLPVVDKDGKFVAHISISDLKLLSLNHDSFSQLLMPLVDFIKTIREKKGKALNNIVSLPQASTLKDVVLKMTQEHVHQLYLVDANQSPVSLISMTKVCEKIFTASKLKNAKDSIKK